MSDRTLISFYGEEELTASQLPKYEIMQWWRVHATHIDFMSSYDDPDYLSLQAQSYALRAAIMNPRMTLAELKQLLPEEPANLQYERWNDQMHSPLFKKIYLDLCWENREDEDLHIRDMARDAANSMRDVEIEKARVRVMACDTATCTLLDLYRARFDVQ